DPYAWGVQQHGWPRVRDMVAANKRLVVIADKDDKRDLGVASSHDLTVENHWSIGNGDQYVCNPRWDSPPLDTAEAGFSRLFVMNQFRDIPMSFNAGTDNSYANLYRRMNEFCVPAARKKPNYIALDFFQNGDSARVVEEVDRSEAILFLDGGF